MRSCWSLRPCAHSGGDPKTWESSSPARHSPAPSHPVCPAPAPTRFQQKPVGPSAIRVPGPWCSLGLTTLAVLPRRPPPSHQTGSCSHDPWPGSGPPDVAFGLVSLQLLAFASWPSPQGPGRSPRPSLLCRPASAPAPLRAYGATPRVLQSVPASSWRAARPRRWDQLPPRAPSPRAPPPVNRGRDRVSRLIRNQRAAGSRPHLQGPAQVWLQVWPLASVLTYSPLSPATCVPVDAEAQRGHPVQRAGAPAAQAARSPVCPARTAAAAAPAATEAQGPGGLELESLKTQKKEEQESARYRRAHRP